MASVKHGIIRDMNALNLTDYDALTDQERKQLQEAMKHKAKSSPKLKKAM